MEVSLVVLGTLASSSLSTSALLSNADRPLDQHTPPVLRDIPVHKEQKQILSTCKLTIYELTVQQGMTVLHCQGSIICKGQPEFETRLGIEVFIKIKGQRMR